MAWGKKPATPSTIDEKKWRNLQDRAIKADPRLADMFSKESARRAHQGAQQKSKREQS